MAVIDTLIEFPKNCRECENKNCNYYHRVWWDCESDNDYSTIRNPKCPLKSIDSITDKIPDLVRYQSEDGQDLIMAYDIIRLIKEVTEAPTL